VHCAASELALLLILQEKELFFSRCSLSYSIFVLPFLSLFLSPIYVFFSLYLSPSKSSFQWESWEENIFFFSDNVFSKKAVQTIFSVVFLHQLKGTVHRCSGQDKYGFSSVDLMLIVLMLIICLSHCAVPT
jgi:hypothetical protein